MLSLDVHIYCVPIKLAHSHKVQLTKGWNAAEHLHPAAVAQRNICVSKTNMSDQDMLHLHDAFAMLQQA